MRMCLWFVCVKNNSIIPYEITPNGSQANSHLMDRLRKAFPASLQCGSPHETIWTLATKQLSGSETRQSWKTPDLWVSFMAGYQGIWFGALPTAYTLYHVSFGLIRQCSQTLILPLCISECLNLCVWIKRFTSWSFEVFWSYRQRNARVPREHVNI